MRGTEPRGAEEPVERYVAVTVNGEPLRVTISGVTAELLADPESLRRFAAKVAEGEAAISAEQRWGAGRLTGECPTFTWTTAETK